MHAVQLSIYFRPSIQHKSSSLLHQWYLYQRVKRETLTWHLRRPWGQQEKGYVGCWEQSERAGLTVWSLQVCSDQDQNECFSLPKAPAKHGSWSPGTQCLGRVNCREEICLIVYVTLTLIWLFLNWIINKSRGLAASRCCYASPQKSLQGLWGYKGEMGAAKILSGKTDAACVRKWVQAKRKKLKHHRNGHHEGY